MESNAQKLDQLKNLLLVEDRDTIAQLETKINNLEQIIQKQDALSKYVNPIIDEKIEVFTTSIPEKLGPTITETLQRQIVESQESIIEALYPIIGKLIKKYISQEIKILSDKINDQVHRTFSLSNFKRRWTAFFTGVSQNDLALTELTKPLIAQLFVIEKGSGILIANSSHENNVDTDLVAGMLTAIKSFVEDAFVKEEQSLELIQYELFNIHIQNFNKYYIAAVISGNFNTQFKNKLENNLLDFAEVNFKNSKSKPSKMVMDLEKIINNE